PYTTLFRSSPHPRTQWSRLQGSTDSLRGPRGRRPGTASASRGPPAPRAPQTASSRRRLCRSAGQRRSAATTPALPVRPGRPHSSQPSLLAPVPARLPRLQTERRSRQHRLRTILPLTFRLLDDVRDEKSAAAQERVVDLPVAVVILVSVKGDALELHRLSRTMP